MHFLGRWGIIPFLAIVLVTVAGCTGTQTIIIERVVTVTPPAASTAVAVAPTVEVVPATATNTPLPATPLNPTPTQEVWTPWPTNTPRPTATEAVCVGEVFGGGTANFNPDLRSSGITQYFPNEANRIVVVPNSWSYTSTTNPATNNLNPHIHCNGVGCNLEIGWISGIFGYEQAVTGSCGNGERCVLRAVISTDNPVEAGDIDIFAYVRGVQNMRRVDGNYQSLKRGRHEYLWVIEVNQSSPEFIFGLQMVVYWPMWEQGVRFERIELRPATPCYGDGGLILRF